MKLLTLGFITLVYLLTISPFVQSGDGGELIVNAKDLTVAHPPGYPLFTFFGHLFSYLPISTMAWRIGFFSVCCQVACAWVIFTLVWEWLAVAWIAAGVTVFYSLAPLTWRYAIEPEVFALNNLFAAVLLWIFFRYQKERAIGWAFGACAVLGLAACHHLTILLFALPFLLVFLWQDRRRLLRAGVFFAGLRLFVMGLLPYLWLFYLGGHREMSGWGDFSGWDGLFTHVLRREYGTFSLASEKLDSGYLSKLYYFAREMLIQAHFVLLVPWVWAVTQLRRRGDATVDFARLLALALAFYGIVFQGLANLDLSLPLYYHVQSRMWILPLLLLILMAGWGVFDLHRRFPRTRLIQGVFGLVLVAGLAFNWRVQDQSKRDFFERLGRTMIENVEPNAKILMREDTYVNVLRYLQNVEGLRPDVHMIPLDLLTFPWMKSLVELHVPGFIVPGTKMHYDPGTDRFTVRQLLEANIEKFPIYVGKLWPSEIETMKGGFNGFPYGFHGRLKKAGVPIELGEVLREAAPFLRLELPDPRSYRWGSWETYVRQNYLEVKLSMAVGMIRHSEGKAEWLLPAAEILEQLAQQSEEKRSDALDNLGNVYAILTITNPAYKDRAVKAWSDYLALQTVETEHTAKLREALKAFNAH